jgi:RNA polymerase sigma-70 factor (ECF subfamily)
VGVVREFDGWYRDVAPRLVAALSFMVDSPEEAGECAAEACARAFERWDRVGVLDNPDGWAFTVGRNLARRRGRRRSTERRLLSTSSLSRPAGMEDPVDELENLVRALPERMREVVVLRHVADLTEPMIAEVLGISRGTVSSTLRDAHRRPAETLTLDSEETSP